MPWCTQHVAAGPLPDITSAPLAHVVMHLMCKHSVRVGWSPRSPCSFQPSSLLTSVPNAQRTSSAASVLSPSASVSNESNIILAWYLSLSMGRVAWRIPRAAGAAAMQMHTCMHARARRLSMAIGQRPESGGSEEPIIHFVWLVVNWVSMSLQGGMDADSPVFRRLSAPASARWFSAEA
jgi:hypothetical protein